MTIVNIKPEVSVSAFDSAAQLIYLAEHRDIPAKERTPWHQEKPQVRQWYRAAALKIYEEALTQFNVEDTPTRVVVENTNEG
jgi:hypothetical protein